VITEELVYGDIVELAVGVLVDGAYSLIADPLPHRLLPARPNVSIWNLKR
jgi:hypothetical protein